jgi:Flp pilus assembly protein TadG
MSRMLAHVKTLLWKATKKVDALRSDQRGLAAIEFAFIAGVLPLGVLNTIDISTYVYKRMEVENATQMAAHAAWKTCDPSKGYLPATTSCPGLTTAITNAVQSTSLGTEVSLQSGSPAEGYYCVNSSGALQYVSPITSKPTDCSAAGMPNLQPGDYIKIQTTFAYAPLFPGVTVAGAFATPITKTALMRLE